MYTISRVRNVAMAVMVLFATGTAMAAGSPDAPRAQREAQKVTASLKLNDDQSKTLNELFVEFANARHEAKIKYGVRSREYRKMMRKLETNLDRQLRNLFSNEQYRRYMASLSRHAE